MAKKQYKGENNMETIVKYTNRKLYSKTRSTYITLEDVKNLIIKEVPFTVTESSTGMNITNETLAAVVAELVVKPQELSADLMKALVINTFVIDTKQE